MTRRRRAGRRLPQPPYNPRGRFLRAWGALEDPANAGRVIIDTMMNLDLLVFAGRQTGQDRYLDIAVAHADTTRRLFPRPDGSTPHVFDLDPATGTPLGPGTVQGYSPASCWSLGQAWGIYGFTTLYRRTAHTRFLDTATHLADYALHALTPDHIPVWDHRAPQQPHDIKDASAAAVMACALTDLATATGHTHYRTTALKILTALARTCLTRTSTRADTALTRCTRNRPAEDGIEIPLPYADYYPLKAILTARALGGGSRRDRIRRRGRADHSARPSWNGDGAAQGRRLNRPLWRTGRPAFTPCAGRGAGTPAGRPR
ncbi:hypothetical protein ACGFZS_48780 [Streptomyces sp. NPDC048288]|uniref:hypothetical protein n=1 Tax=Streptomyces sp. NPDC048288 TaxID=3365529 RepID=UPI0037147FE2